jgi:hypothetical protein
MARCVSFAFGCIWNSFNFFLSKRAELKLQSEEEQARVAALNKEYQATYRERYEYCSKKPRLLV